MTLAEFASRLQKAKAKTFRGQPGFTACCPAHGDSKPSFAVWEGADGWLHMKCQTGCTEDQVLAAMGLDQSARRVQEPVPIGAGGEETIYPYTDATGAYLFEKYRPIDPSKGKCRQRIRTPAGTYIHSLESLNGQGKTLYRLGEVLSAVRRGETIYVNEGEKAVEAFRLMGCTATCQPSGAGPGKWLDQHTAVLRGADVVIVADRDDVGEAYAGEVAVLLLDVARSVRVVQSKTTEKGDDAYDHFLAGGTVGDFVDRSDLIKVEIPGMVCFEEDAFEPEVVEFVWEPYLPLGRCVMFVADSGVGKTALFAGIFAGLSIGQLPNGEGACPPARCALFASDSDSPRAYETVYRACGGKPGGAIWIPGSRTIQDLAVQIRHLVRMKQIKLIAIDPFFNFLADSNIKNPNEALEATRAMGIFSSLAEQLNICIVIIHHTGKGGDMKSAGESGLGSVMFKARARGYLEAKKHPTEKGVVIVRDEKGSILVPRGEPFAFRRVGRFGEIEYIADFKDPLLEDQGTTKGQTEQWIRDNVPAEWTPSAQVEEAAKASGFKIGGQWKKVRAELCDTRKDGRHWYVRLKDPFADEEDLQDPVYRGGE